MKLIHSLNRPYINYYTLSKSNFFALLNSGMNWVKKKECYILYSTQNKPKDFFHKHYVHTSVDKSCDFLEVQTKILFSASSSVFISIFRNCSKNRFSNQLFSRVVSYN